MPQTDRRGRASARPFARLIFASASLLLALTVHTHSHARGQPQPSKRITTASGARVRSAPDTAAAEVARLQLGVVVDELERSQEKSKVGGSEDFWYMVSTPEGARGWVFGGLTAPFDPARREEIYTRIAAERAAKSDATFVDASELVRFAERAAKEVTHRDSRAEIEFARLRALARSISFLAAGEQQTEAYKQWAAQYDSEITYSEPSGEWYVRAERFWDLQAKYKDLPIAERIAWEAAATPLPGECEGDVTCNLYYLSETSGRYLKLYPRGAHSADALKSLEETIDAVVEDSRTTNRLYEIPSGTDADFKKALATLRGQLTPPATPRAAQLIKQLDEITRISRGRR